MRPERPEGFRSLLPLVYTGSRAIMVRPVRPAGFGYVSHPETMENKVGWIAT